MLLLLRHMKHTIYLYIHTAAAVNGDDEDDLHRLTFSTSISDPTDLELVHRRDSSLGGLDAFYPNGGMKISPIKQQQKQSRRRRYFMR